MRGPDYCPAPLLPATSTPTNARKLTATTTNHYPWKMPAGTPICRCRVLYMGSSVPHITKDGLHGIQEPLRELYPEDGILGALGGIDSWLSVWSNGLLLENVDEKQKKVTRFFPIDSLHYCAAVRHVCVPPPPPPPPQALTATGSPKGPKGPIHRFLPLDSPFARIPTPNNPPLFAAILRRTTGIKVLECHAFVCKKEMAANALVRCCFHAYADNACAQRMHQQENMPIYSSVASLGSRPGSRPGSALEEQLQESPPAVPKKSQSHGNLLAVMATIENGAATEAVNGVDSAQHLHNEDDEDEGTVVDDGSATATITYAATNGHNGDENHKIWSASNSSTEDQQSFYGDYATNTLRSAMSVAGSTSTRSGRPRQLTCPMSPPPPPPNPPRSRDNSDNQESGPRRAIAYRRPHGMPIVPMMHHASNGYLPIRPAPGGRWMQQHQQQPQMQMLPRPHIAPPPPPHHAAMMMVPIGPTPPSSVITQKGASKSKSRNGRSKEPIYIATGRPMSPLSSHGPQMPYDQYLLHQQQMALTLPNNNSKKKQQSNGNLDALTNGQKVGASPICGAGEKFNTGIYRKKGHLNERAFSYSIKQEHRSRSHNSLTTLAFTNGHHADDSDSSPVGPKKSLAANGNGVRLSARMNDLSLSLSDDELEKDDDVSSALTGLRMTNGMRHSGTPITNGSKSAVKLNGNAKLKR